MPLPKLRRLRKCPICIKHGKKNVDGCGLGERAILCWRVESPRQAQSGAYIHPIEDAQGVPVRRFYLDAPIAHIDRRHAVFSAFLDALTLSGEHADQLSGRRGLSDETILRNQFATVPDRFTAMQVVEQLGKDHDLTHIPGFFFNARDRWQLRLYQLPGFYIPLRDPQGRIQALQIRQDTDEKKRRYILLSTPPAEFRDGASSGAPIHYVHPERSGAAIIIEGGLKGIVCGDYSRYRYISFVSVTTFPERIGWIIRDALNCKGLAIAYDADQRTNPHVALQAKRLIRCLNDAGFHPPLITWPAEQGNGLDDYLMSGNSI